MKKPSVREKQMGLDVNNYYNIVCLFSILSTIQPPEIQALDLRPFWTVVAGC